jgi:hypothetical protein
MPEAWAFHAILHNSCKANISIGENAFVFQYQSERLLCDKGKDMTITLKPSSSTQRLTLPSTELNPNAL